MATAYCWNGYTFAHAIETSTGYGQWLWLARLLLSEWCVVLR
jgi:hypothetical protein